MGKSGGENPTNPQVGTCLYFARTDIGPAMSGDRTAVPVKT